MLPPFPEPMSALPNLPCTNCQSHLRAIYTYIYLAVVLNKYTMWELSGEPCRFRTLDFNPIACLESIDSVVMTGWGKGGKGTWQGGKDWRLNSGLGSDCLWEYTVSRQEDLDFASCRLLMYVFDKAGKLDVTGGEGIQVKHLKWQYFG